MSGRHVHGLPGLLNLITNGMLGKAGHSATISVTVAVNPVTAAAKPGTPAYLVGGVDHVTGTVSGELDANDPDPHTLTYSLTDGPSRGIVTLNPDSGGVYVHAVPDRPASGSRRKRHSRATSRHLHRYRRRRTRQRHSGTRIGGRRSANTDPALNLLVSDPDSDGSVRIGHRSPTPTTTR